MLAARGKLGGQSPALGTEHIGCPQWMREARQIGGPIQDLDPDEAAASWQLQLGQGPPMIERHVGRGLGRVSMRVEGSVVGCDSEHEARPERMGRAQQVAEIDGL
jgi:hypothetical protein